MLTKKADHELTTNKKDGITEQEDRDLRLLAEIICNILLKEIEIDQNEQTS